MLNMDRPESQIFYRDSLAGVEWAQLLVVSDIHERREEGRVGIDDGVCDPAQVNRDVFIQKSEMADVIAVVMGKEDGIDVRTFVGEIRELEHGAAIQLGDLR